MNLLDTNVIICFLNGSLPSPAMDFVKTIIDEQSVISIVTKMEALGFNFKNIAEQTSMELFVNGSTSLPIDDVIVNQTILIRRSKKIALPDAIIAATAISYGLRLITQNTADFINIPSLDVLNPVSMQA